jgi:hypothetical protein
MQKDFKKFIISCWLNNIVSLQISLGSEMSHPFGFSGFGDDSSNDALVIVDDQPGSNPGLLLDQYSF